MTEERQDILEDFYAGNTKNLRITVTDGAGLPKDLTDAGITFSLFTEATKTAPERIVVTKSSTNLDQIFLLNAVSGLLMICLKPVDTFNLYGTFRYHVNVIDSNDNEETVTTGKINIFKSFAKRSRLAIPLPAYLIGQMST